MSLALKATAVASLVLALGHGFKGTKMFSKDQFNALSPRLGYPAKIGWYQGVGFMGIAALLNYKWSITGLDSIDKVMAGIAVVMYFASSYSYNLVKDPARVPTLICGLLQAYSAFLAS